MIKSSKQRKDPLGLFAEAIFLVFLLCLNRLETERIEHATSIATETYRNQWGLYSIEYECSPANVPVKYIISVGDSFILFLFIRKQLIGYCPTIAIHLYLRNRGWINDTWVTEIVKVHISDIYIIDFYI